MTRVECVLCGLDDPELLVTRELALGGVVVEPAPWVCADEAGCYESLLIAWADS